MDLKIRRYLEIRATGNCKNGLSDDMVQVPMNSDYLQEKHT
jgi:hypothetical protein